ncbi:MAG: HAMP domain-containing sensor histidine kinase [Pseudomonadota bacterium]
MPWPSREMRRQFLTLLSAVAGLMALGFAAYHLAMGHPERAVASLSAAAVVGVMLVALRRCSSDRPAFAVAAAYAMGATLFLLASPAFPAGDFIWCLLIPPLVAYAGGARLARWVLPAYLVAACLLVLRPGFYHRAALTALELPVRFLSLLALLSVVAWAYEHARAIALDKMSAEVEERRAAERSLEEANQRLAEVAAEAERLAAQAQTANEAKSRFLSQLNHDIRTPLTGIVGMTSLLELTELDAEQRHFLETIRVSGSTLAELFDQIFDLTRLESGGLVPLAVPFQPRDLVEEVQIVINPLAEERALRLLVEVSPELPQVLVGDPRQVRRILLNLASNAVRFTDRGEVALWVGPSPTGAGWWRLMVRDTGIGISEQHHQRIFESFTQVHADPAARRGGTGLGLAICARLVQALGGRMHLESREGCGSTFFVDLPARIQPAV